MMVGKPGEASVGTTAAISGAAILVCAIAFLVHGLIVA
jgi:hypothetical protein